MTKVQRRTRRLTLESALNNSLRGKNSTSESILSVHRLIMSHQSEVISDLNPNVQQNAFRVPLSGFGLALDISNNNLVQIEKLSKNSNSVVELNYLKLATAYIVENPDRVNNWVALDTAASTEAFAGDPETIRDLLLALPSVDQQALSSMRLYAALHSFSDDIIREYLSRNMPSHWMKDRLLYPLIYYSLNLPDPHALDQMLAQVFPNVGTGKGEKILTRLLLQPDYPEAANLSLRCYVGLISHPYDALEYIVTELEQRCANGDVIDSEHLKQYAKLAVAFPAHRVARLVGLARQQPLPFNNCPSDLLGFAFPSKSAERDALLAVLDAREEVMPTIAPRAQILTALIEFRWSRYPDPVHFEELNSYHRRFAVLSSARLVRYIATSLFLFEREEPEKERLILLQGALLTGIWSPFSASGPQGYSVTSAARLPISLSPSEALTKTGEILNGDAERRNDRIWIKAANWSLMALQAEGRISAWAASAHGKFPIWIQPRYLSGLDWYWLSGVIDALGMRSLVGNLDMVYVLFLKQLEQFRRESMPLRVAIEPFLRSAKSMDDISTWLHDNLKEDTVAFVRFFLNADTILKLRLADNYMAAASARLDLLARAVREYRFTPGVFEEADLEREQDVLTAMLCRMSVGTRQFEIGWDALRDHAVERTRDAYAAYETISQAMPDESIANTRRSSTFQYANGATVDYEARNREWPLVLLIAGVIETFLTHPTTGIEAILSTRIRHDHFRREYENAIHDVETSKIEGSSQLYTKHHAKELAPPLYREVQRWLDSRMHTRRKDKPQAFFNFVPSKREMTGLLAEALNKNFDEIITMVFDWTKPRLASELTKARVSLSKDLAPALEKKIPGTRGDAAGSKDSVKSRVADAVAASIARRTRDLDEWFKVPDGDRDQSLTVGEVMIAVHQRFRMHHNSGGLEWRELPSKIANRIVAPAHIRHLYDLFSEIVHNALKHSKKTKTVIRISTLGGSNIDTIIVTNNRLGSDLRHEEITGHPFQSVHDSLFGEGKSGLKKIAYISASICNKPTDVAIRESKHHFHLAIPVDAVGQRCGG
jgi:hypothetical protein